MIDKFCDIRPLLPAGLLLLGACSATGAATGLVTSDGSPAGQARFSYVTHGGASARLLAEMPDGERFEGNAISGSQTSEPSIGFVFDDGGRRPQTVIATGSRTWTGEIDAWLTGSHGHSMQCHLREKRPGLGLEGGATGSCRVSDGRQIVADF